MPFASDKQRKFMYSQHPRIAARWTREAKEKGVPVTKKTTPKQKAKK